MILVVASIILGAHARAAAPAATAALPPMPAGWPLAVAIILGLQAVVYTIDGWDGVIYFGEEVRDPGRDIPRAIFGSVFSVMGIYLLLNLAALYVLPMNEIAGNDFVLGTVADRVFGRFGDPTIRSIMIISMLSCVNSNLLFSSRTLHAMSCDGLFFRRVTNVNSGGTPALSLLLSTIVSVFFVLGSFERVIAMLSFFFVANYTLTYISLFVLRRKEPEMNRPYRAWGYPWTTAIALLASAMFLVGSIATDRDNAPLALGMFVLSYPVFRVLKRVSRRGSSATLSS
jgi:APA family basic amino acid/polyamine antiporter